MPSATAQRAGDPRLQAFLGAATDTAAAESLDALLGGETDRIIRDTVRRELGASRVGAAYAEDIASEVRLCLMRKLWALRSGARDPIDNFLGYAATAAEHGCYAFLRRQFPERTRFRNRVRYAAAHHPRTSLTRDAHGVWRCHTRHTLRRAPVAGATRLFLDDPRAWIAAMKLNPASALPALIDAVLSRLDEAIELDALVDALATVLGIVDAHPASPRHDAPALLERLPDPAPGAGTVLEQREALARVWREIVELPSRQRAALLLNLRDPEGGAILQMLPATGVVSTAEIAAALEIGDAQLAALWDTLPMDDLSIARLLGLTRQQVINLRKTARARLSRRVGDCTT